MCLQVAMGLSLLVMLLENNQLGVIGWRLFSYNSMLHFFLFLIYSDL